MKPGPLAPQRAPVVDAVAGVSASASAAEAAATAAAPAADPWADAQLAATLLAVCPQGLGGVRVRGAAGELRDRWLQGLRAAWPADAPWQRLPLHVDDERLLGGLDLGATLQRGTVVLQQGLLARTDGGVLLVPMAERMAPALAAKLVAVLDAGSVAVQRSGVAAHMPARLAVVALDEGQGGGADPHAGSTAGTEGDTESPPLALLERLGLCVNLQSLQHPTLQAADLAAAWSLDAATGLAAAPQPTHPLAPAVQAARQRLPGVRCSDEILQALCEAALALGVPGLRASLFALAAARAHAAWCGRDEVTVVDAAAASRLVLAPRATRVPAAPAAEDTAPAPAPVSPDEADNPDPNPEADAAAVPPAAPPPPPDPAEPPQDLQAESPAEDAPVQDQLVQAAQAAIPQGLLALLAGAAGRAPAGAGGRAGALQASRLRGRPYGSRRGDPRSGARLHLIDTLRAAAPWQLLRRREQGASGAAVMAPKPVGEGVASTGAKHRSSTRADPSPALAAVAPPPSRPAVLVLREDFHISRFRQRRETTTLFVVDASGSAAMHRLAEAKGAVELLLADCYVRRDQVALLAFRGPVGAELLLPPTRSLVRAKRSLAALAGGGGTPLAAALDQAREITQAIVRKGGTPLAVFLTDGRANIARDGSPGRERAHADAMASARLWQASGLGALWIDTAQQPQAQAQQIAQAMGARYLPLPMADAQQVSKVVTALR